MRTSDLVASLLLSVRICFLVVQTTYSRNYDKSQVMQELSQSKPQLVKAAVPSVYLWFFVNTLCKPAVTVKLHPEQRICTWAEGGVYQEVVEMTPTEEVRFSLTNQLATSFFPSKGKVLGSTKTKSSWGKREERQRKACASMHSLQKAGEFNTSQWWDAQEGR